MAQKQPFRSIEIRGRQSSVRTDMTASDRSQQLAELARQQSQRLQASNQAREARERFSNFNQQALEQTAIEQQRLQAQQMSTNDKLAAQAQEIIGKQRLEGQRMKMNQENQIRNMRNAQSIVRNQLQQQLTAQQNQSISEFGNQLLTFSQTLYKQKADEINEANKRLQAQGKLDGMLQNLNFGNDTINTAQSARVATGMRMDNEARQLEAEGLPNDATNLRAHNGFYAYGVQEGIAIKNAFELRGYLQKAKEEALEKGILQLGGPNADQKLQVFLQEKTIDFMIERGLDTLPPEILNKYLAEEIITSQLAVVTEFTKANNKFTKESSIGLARQQIRTASLSPTFAEDLPNLLMTLYGKDTGNISDNLGKVLIDLKADALDRNDITALETFITVLQADERLVPFSQDVFSDYLKFKEEYENKAATASNKAYKEQADMLYAEFLLRLNSGAVNNAQDLVDQQTYYAELAEQLPLRYAGPLMEKILKKQIDDVSVIETGVNVFLSEARSPREIRDYVERNQGLPTELQSKLLGRANKLENFFEDNPKYQDALDTAKAGVENQRPPFTTQQLNRNPELKAIVDAVVKRRQEQLEQRFYDWVGSEGDKETKDFLEWLQEPAQQQLINSKIVISQDDKGRNYSKELQVDTGSYESGIERGDEFGNGLQKQKINGTNNEAVFYTGSGMRRSVLLGRFGNIDSEQGVFLTRPEIIRMTEVYEKTGLVDPLLQDFASRANVTPVRFLEDQAKLYGMEGGVITPEQAKVAAAGGRVSRQSAMQYAATKGLSRRGSIWFASVMMAESGGVSTTEHDQGTGYGLFAHRLSRRDALFEYAAQKGKPKSDPQTQMDFALYELETYYPSIWAVITAPNPTTASLVKAQKDWMRFNSQYDERRRRILTNDLNNN